MWVRRIVVFLGMLPLALAGGCAPKAGKKGAKALPEPLPPAPLIVSSVKIDSTGGRSVARDGEHRLSFQVPAGWSASMSFRADASGPPPVGELRVRIEERAAGCVVDVAIESAETLDRRDLRESISRGREVFFLAETDEPAREKLPHTPMVAATLVLHDPSRVDVGYWIDLGDGRWIRVEGRFPVSGVIPCKASLDEIVGSLSRIGPALENLPAAEVRRPDDGG